MNPARCTPITLSAALLLGVALGLGGPRGKQSAPEGSNTPLKGFEVTARDAGATATRAGLESSSSVRTAASSTADAYAMAWELLKDGKLPRMERRDLECALLEEWCQIDLRAALEAAFGEEGMAVQDPFAESPLDACFSGILEQPDLVWELVSSREYGLHTRQLRSLWIEACAGTRPLEVMHRLPEMPAEVRHDAIYEAASSTHRREDPAPGRDAVAAAVLALLGTPDGLEAMEGFAKGLLSAMKAGELGLLVAKQQDPALRDLYLSAYVRGFKFSSTTQILTELEKLPAELRAEVESRLGQDTPAPEGLFPVTEPQRPPPEE